PGANAKNEDDKAQPKMLIQLALRGAAAGYHVVVLMHDNYVTEEKCKSWAKTNGWSTVKSAPYPSEDDCMTNVMSFYTQCTALNSGTVRPFNARGAESSYKPVATDSIENRLGLFLAYLDQSFPSQYWGTFRLQTCNTKYQPVVCSYQGIDWSKIALAGHSMGS